MLKLLAVAGFARDEVTLALRTSLAGEDAWSAAVKKSADDALAQLRSERRFATLGRP